MGELLHRSTNYQCSPSVVHRHSDTFKVSPYPTPSSLGQEHACLSIPRMSKLDFHDSVSLLKLLARTSSTASVNPGRADVLKNKKSMGAKIVTLKEVIFTAGRDNSNIVDREVREIRISYGYLDEMKMYNEYVVGYGKNTKRLSSVRISHRTASLDLYLVLWNGRKRLIFGELQMKARHIIESRLQS